MIVARSSFITLGWCLSILGVQRGSPTVIQTMMATTPMWLIGWESIHQGRLPSTRSVLAATLVVAGILVTLVWLVISTKALLSELCIIPTRKEATHGTSVLYV